MLTLQRLPEAPLDDLFPPESTDAVRLRKPVAVRQAVLRDGESATCEHVRVCSTRPLTALCCALALCSSDDSPLQVTDERGAAVCFIESIHQAAIAAVREALASRPARGAAL